MEFSLIIPLAGVILGWVLSQVSTALAGSREDKRLRRSSIPPMLELYFQQYRIDKILKYFNYSLNDALEKLTASCSDMSSEQKTKIVSFLLSRFELTRQGNLDLPKKNKEAMYSSLAEAIKALSKVDPINSYRLSRLLNEFILLLEIKFPEDRLNPKEYLEAWGMLLSTYRNDIQSLRSLILRTSFRVGLIEYLRMLILIRKEEMSLIDPPDELMENLSKIIRPSKESADALEALLSSASEGRTM